MKGFSVFRDNGNCPRNNEVSVLSGCPIRTAGFDLSYRTAQFVPKV